MTIASQDKHKQLESKLLDLAFEKIGFSAVSALSLAALIVIALWPIVEHERLLIWLGAMALIQALSFLYARRYKSARGIESEPRKWRAGLVAGGAVAGLCWGSTVFGFPSTPFNPQTVLGIFVLPSSPFDPVTVLLMFILAGVAAYASVAMAFVPSFAIVFLACTLLPLSIWLLSFGEHMYVVMSLIALSYFGVMVMLSRRMHATVCSLISVTEENRGLRTEQQESGWRMQQFFKSAPGFFYTACMTPDGKSSMPFVSAGIHELFDLASGEVAESMAPMFALVHAEDIERIVDAREASRRNLSPFHIEFRINHRIKGVCWIELHSLPKREPDGSTYWHGFMQDITRRKRLEESLAAREREFRTLAENFPDVVIRYDLDGRRTYVNRALAELAGIEPDEMLGKFMEDTPLLDPEAYIAELRKAITTRDAAVLDVAARGVNGEVSWYQARFVPESDAGNNVSGVLMVAGNITERRRMEQELLRRETGFRTLAENLPVAVIRYDAEQRRRYINPAAERMLHGNMAELLDKVPGDGGVPATPEMIAFYRSKMDEVLKSGEVRELEFVLDALPAEEQEYYEVRFASENSADGKPGGVLSIWFDITGRKRMENEMLQQANFQQTLLNAINEVGLQLMVIEDGRINYASNLKLAREFGYSEEEIAAGVPLMDIVHPDDRERVMDYYVRRAAGEASPNSYELSLVTKSGERRKYETSVAVLPGTSPLRIISVGKDITERKAMESALHESEARYRHSSNLLQSIFESPSQMGIYALDREYRYLAFNSQFREGAKRLWDADIAVGMSMLDSIDSEAHREICRQGFAQVLAGHSFSLETKEAVLKDGITTYEYHENFGAPIRNDNGEIIGLTIFTTEISERKAIESVLHDSESMLQEAQRIAHVGSWDVDMVNDRLVWSDEIFRIWEIDKTQFKANFAAFLETVHPEDQERVVQIYNKAISNHSLYEVEHRLLFPDGRVKYIQERGEPQYDAQGKPVRFIGTALDITERKRMEAELAVREQEFRALVDQAPEPIFRYAPDGRRIYVNAAVERISGIPASVLLGEPSSDGKVVSTQAGAAVTALVMRICATGEPGEIEVENVGSDGHLHYFHNRLAPEFDADGKVRSVFSISHDITARKEMELALSESQIRYRQVFDNAQEGMFLLEVTEDRRFRVIESNPTFARLIGIPRDGMIDQFVDEILLPETAQKVSAKYNRCIDSGEVYSEEQELHLPVGLHIYHTTLVPVRNDAGRIVRLVGITSDVTESKRMQEALQASERDFRSLAENLPDNVARWDLEGRYLYLNPVHEHTLGVAASEHIGKANYDTHAQVMASIEQVVASGQAVTFKRLPMLVDGITQLHDVTLAPERDAEGRIVSVLGIGRDMTYIYRMQDELAERERDFRSLAANLPDNIARWDVEGLYLYINPTHERLLGVAASEVVGKPLPDTHEHVKAAIAQVVATGQMVELVRQSVLVDGELQTHEVTLVPEFDAAGHVVSVLGLGRNMTEFYRMRDAIAAREQELRALAESSPGMMGAFYFRPDGSICMPYVSQKIEELFGLLPQDVVNDATPLLAMNHPDDAQRVADSIAESARTMTTWHEEYRIIHPTRGECWMESNTSPEPHPDGGIVWYGYVHDITERKRAQQKLELLDRAIDMSADAVFLMNEQLRLIYVNATACRALGYSREELLAMDVCDIDPDVPREVVVKIIKESPLGVASTIETRHRAKDGHTFPVEISGVQFEEGGARLGLTVARDITERKRMESALRESRNFLNRIIDSIPDPIFVKDREHRWLLGNEAFCKLVGQPRENLIGKSDYDFLSKEQSDVFWEKDEQVFDSGVTNLNEESITAGSGETRYLHTQKTPFISADGQALLVGVIRDITERKQAEQALRASEEQAQSRSNLLNAIVESSPDVIVFALDTQYRYLSFNRKHKEVMQAIWGKEIAAGMSMLDVIGSHPDRAAAKSGFDRALSGESFVLEEAYGDELLSRQYWMNYWSPIRADAGEVVGLTCFVMNVTERRRIEEAMRANEEKLSTLFALSPLGIALTDMQGRYVEFNEAFRTICGYPADELMTLDYWTLTPKKYEAQEAVQLEALAKTGRYGPYEKEYRQKDGTPMPIQLNGMLVTGKDGQQYIWSIVEDIRERKQAEVELQKNLQRISKLNVHLEQNARDLEEQAVELEMSKEQLQQTEAWYRSILHSAPDGMLIIDSRGLIMQVNAQLEAMFGYEGGELPGCSIEVLLPQAARAGHVDKRAGFISGAQRDRRMAGAAKDLFGCRKDGSEFPVDVSLSRLPDLDGRVGTICAAVRDVTERQKADVARESALSEALRLAQLRSTFLAQMSHELRTPLNGILGYTQNLLRGEALGENQRSGLNIIQHSGEHLLTLINGILDHAAIEADKFELILGDIELESFLGTIIGIIRVRAEQKNIAFSCDAGVDLPAIVRGDAQRLRQILLNLLSNAVKFTDKGQVILRVTYPALSRLRFEVQDSGVGIAADQLDSIFLPFEQVGETSRRAGGTGLGLAISRKLVGLMGGSINVESQPGAGSVFSFEVEMVADQSAAAKVNAAALSEQSATRSSPLTSLLFAPPPQELDVLHGLALRGNMRDVARQATRLAELDPRYMSFAEHLRQLSKGFQTKALLGFIAQYRDKKECE